MVIEYYYAISGILICLWGIIVAFCVLPLVIISNFLKYPHILKPSSKLNKVFIPILSWSKTIIVRSSTLTYLSPFTEKNTKTVLQKNAYDLMCHLFSTITVINIMRTLNISIYGQVDKRKRLNMSLCVSIVSFNSHFMTNCEAKPLK